MARKRKSQGLGDTIEKITTATGIKAAVKFLAGEDCGCNERKEKLNKLFPYRKPKCLNEEDYKSLDNFFKEKKSLLYLKDQRMLSDIYERVFGVKLEQTSCDSCWRDYVSQLNKIYNEYN